MTKTATEIMVRFDNDHRFYPIGLIDPLQELLAGTFYLTIEREYPNAELASLLASLNND